MNEQKVISVDSQILSSIQSCALKTKYAFVDHLTGLSKAEPLERGDLLHKMLEIYYGLSAKILSTASEMWEFLPLTPESILHESIPKPDSIHFAVKAGKQYAVKLSLPDEEVQEVIFHFIEYCKHYVHDSWHPLAVEGVGSRVLFESPEIKIIYTVKIDMIAEQGNLIMPWDHKSSRRRSDPRSLSNQFMGYCWTLDMLHIMVNKIGFQKSLKPQERFQREIITYSRPRLEEWRLNSIWWIKRLLFAIETNEWPMTLTSCEGKFAPCLFDDICDADPGSRLHIIDTKYKVGEVWDPAKMLEGKL